MPTTSTTATLAALEAAQKSRSIMAFDKGGDLRRVARLQTVYANKRAQLESFYQLFDETNPDFVLRAPSGQELVLRLPLGDTGTVMSSLRDALESALRELEADIVTDLRPAILALCVPAATSITIPVAEAPTSLPVLPAGQRLFVTPPTRHSTSAV
jgi:hypothetical protein